MLLLVSPYAGINFFKEKKNWSRHNRGAAARVEAIGDQQLNWMQSGSNNWIDEIGKQ